MSQSNNEGAATFVGVVFILAIITTILKLFFHILAIIVGGFIGGGILIGCFIACRNHITAFIACIRSEEPGT